MKTKIAVAVSAAIMSTGVMSEPTDKYQLGSQDWQQTSTSTIPVELDQAYAPKVWMVVLEQGSVTEQSRRKGVSPSQAKVRIEQSQADVIDQVNALDNDLEVVSTTSLLVNSVLVEGDAAQAKALAQLPGVKSVRPITPKQLYIEDSANYIGASELRRNGGPTGKGQTVGILDTGVDYTHKALGGTGKREDYEFEANHLDVAPAWPQGKIVGGYDFVRDQPNPLDVDYNHGTHVTHSTAGIASDAQFYVYSVCMRYCPEIAQINALERAMDPNNDGNISDRVDTVNMSLGGSFGDLDGDATELLIDEMVKLGVNVVISAGNDGLTPFVVGNPSTTKNALSVAAMTHPTGTIGIIEATMDDAKIEAQPAGFNPTNIFSFNQKTAPLVYSEDNPTGCDAFDNKALFDGKAALIDRGGCSFVTKVINAQDAGAQFVIIANNLDEPPFPMGGYDAAVNIPSVMVSLKTGNDLKIGLDVGALKYSVTSKEVATTDGVAIFSSRGPAMSGLLKPEITAPGVSILTAEPGTGDELTPVSGTSFSSPIAAGAVSVIREAFPDRTPLEIKATLMNSANPTVYLAPPAVDPDGPLAPISFIGAGLIDLEAAVETEVIAWDKATSLAALSFGIVPASNEYSVTKQVEVKNFSNEDKTYSLKRTSRHQQVDTEDGVTFDLPDTITVKAGQSTKFPVTMYVHPDKLPTWGLFSGDGDILRQSDALTASEYAGFINFMDGEERALQLVYYALPKAVASAAFGLKRTDDEQVRTITNTSKTLLSDPIAVPLTAADPLEADIHHDILSVSTETLPSDYCADAGGFAMFNTFVMRDPIVHPMMGSYRIEFDTDNDGVWDYEMATINHKWVKPGHYAATYLWPVAGGAGYLGGVLHSPGNNFLTTDLCISEIGLDENDIGNDITVRYRVEEDSWVFTPYSGLADEVVAHVKVAPSDMEVTMLNDKDEEISELASGQTAVLKTENTGNGYIILAENGGIGITINNSDDANSAPTIQDLSLQVAKGTKGGTEIGQFIGTDPDDVSSPISEYIVMYSNSTLLRVTPDGRVVLSDTAVINQSTETMTATVVALDTLGNASNPAKLTVMVINTKPTVSIASQTAEVGSTVTLEATGEDEDGDELTYEFSIIDGEKVQLTQDGNKVTFEAPDSEGEVSIGVTASDTLLRSDMAVATVTFEAPAADVEEEEKPPHHDGGSLGWLSLLTMPAIWYRRKKLHKDD